MHNNFKINKAFAACFLNEAIFYGIDDINTMLEILKAREFPHYAHRPTIMRLFRKNWKEHKENFEANKIVGKQIRESKKIDSEIMVLWPEAWKNACERSSTWARNKARNRLRKKYMTLQEDFKCAI